MNFFNITKEGKNIDNIIKYLIDFIPKNSVFFIIIDNDPYILQYNISDGYKLLKKNTMKLNSTRLITSWHKVHISVGSILL